MSSDNLQLTPPSPKAGYKHSLDPFIISGFVEGKKIDKIADLGAGSGIISILLAKKFVKSKILAIEYQFALSKEAKREVIKNNLEKRIDIICSDIKTAQTMFHAEQFDIVVGNPPYRRANDGRINLDPGKAIARHEIKITLSQYLSACNYLVRPSGKIFLIYHPYRLNELITQLTKHKIIPSKIRFVHSKADREACMVMVEAVKNGKNDLVVQKPFFIYKDSNSYSDEMSEIYKKAGF